MAYSKTTWVTGDVVTATKLNHAEDGIATAQSTAEGAAASVAALGANGAIGTANLAPAAVTNAKLDQEAVDSNNIRTGAIVTPLIYDGAVTLAKLADAVKEHFATADDVSKLENALNLGLSSGIHIVPLNLSNSPATRFVSQKIYIGDIDLPITFDCDNDEYSFYIAFYKSDDTFISTTVWRKGSYTLNSADIPAETNYFCMTCKADDGHSLADAEKEYFSCYYEYALYLEIESIKDKLSTVYVDGINGNDGNNGQTATTAFKTITKALSVNPKEILVKPGTYSERLNITNVHGLSISPYNYGTFDGTSYDDKIILDGIDARPYLLVLDNCSDISLVGVKAINYLNSGIKMTNCTRIVCKNCEAGDQSGTYQYGIGFELINTDADFESCYAHDVTLDGFNIHGFGETRFVNCIAKNCGDDGISHHDACVGYISGGEYSECGKGGISSPTYGSYVNIDSAYCHDNLFGIYAVSNSANRKSKALISNCAVKDNTNADFYVDYADVTAWNNRYVTKTVGSNGTFTEVT